MDRGILDNLKDILQERISFSESVRNNHAKGEDAYDPVLPRQNRICLLYTSPSPRDAS